MESEGYICIPRNKFMKQLTNYKVQLPAWILAIVISWVMGEAIEAKPWGYVAYMILMVFPLLLSVIPFGGIYFLVIFTSFTDTFKSLLGIGANIWTSCIVDTLVFWVAIIIQAIFDLYIIYKVLEYIRS